MTAKPGTRAVSSRIEPYNNIRCHACDGLLTFRARHKHHQIIANVYQDDKWDRVEHWHPDCYQTADQPHGPPTLKKEKYHRDDLREAFAEATTLADHQEKP